MFGVPVVKTIDRCRNRLTNLFEYQTLEAKQLLAGDLSPAAAEVQPSLPLRTHFSTVPDRALPHEITANYREDFSSASDPNSRWNFWWNAPEGWTDNGPAGDLQTGKLSHTSLFQPLEFDGLMYRAGAGELRANLPANYLMLTSVGGHPGSHAANENGHDRFAIVSYTVAQSGFYSIVDSVISKVREMGDGIEVILWVGNDTVSKTVSAEPGHSYSSDFNTNLGFLEKGESVFAAVGTKGDHLADSFLWDFSIAKFDAKVLGDYRDDFGKANSNWSYSWNAPIGWTTRQPNSPNWPAASMQVAQVHEPLIPIDGQLTPDGNLNFADSYPAGFLSLNATGGVAGLSAHENNSSDRFAIAAYKVAASGYFAITDSFIQKTSGVGNGIELLISDSSGNHIKQLFVDPMETASLDSYLGFIGKGESIYVSIGPDGDHSADVFEMDLTIVAEPMLRADPVRDMVTPREVRVRDFGAIPNDGNNDRVQIQRAINAAAEMQKSTGEAVRIRLDAGTYEFQVVDDTNLLFQNVKDLVFQGSGQDETELLFSHQRARGFRVVDSQNLIFKDFSIDHEQLPFTQGVVQSVVNANTLIVRVDAGFRAPNDPDLFDPELLTSYRTQFLDAGRSGRLLDGEAYRIADLSSIVQVGPDTYQVSYGLELPETVESGVAWYQIARANPRSNFNLYRNQGWITISDVTSYASPSGFAQGQLNHQVDILNANIELKDNRLVSVLGDAVHSQRNHVGSWIENSSFEGLSDDVVSMYRIEIDYLESQLSPNLFLVNSNSNLFAGDEIIFYRDDGYREEARIASIFENYLKTDRAITGFGDNTRIAPLEYASRNSVIRDNVFSNHRAGHGTIIMWSPNSTMIGNKFSGINTRAIAANAYTESTMSDGMVVQGNRFSDVGFSSWLDIHQWPTVETGRNAHNSIVADNVFSQLAGVAIRDPGVDSQLSANFLGNDDPASVDYLIPAEVREYLRINADLLAEFGTYLEFDNRLIF